MKLCSTRAYGIAGALCLSFVALAQPSWAQDKRHPVNCATAEGDLRAIAAEKKHAETQQAESVLSVTPAGALLGLITGTENKHLKMLSGDYVQQLDDRSAEIKSTCGIK
jgi:hypothetical protein